MKFLIYLSCFVIIYYVIHLMHKVFEFNKDIENRFCVHGEPKQGCDLC